MRYNTFITYPMTAGYRTFEVVEREPEFFYREYGTLGSINCLVTVNAGGHIQLMFPQPLQTFAIISDITDAGGADILGGQWFSVNRVSPVMDGMGYLSSYRHSLAKLDGSLIMEPVSRPVSYPDLDQTP